jgi:hypothetical protein
MAEGSSTAESKPASDSGKGKIPTSEDALGFLGKAIENGHAPWIVRLRAAALILGQEREKPARVASRKTGKAKPKAEPETGAENNASCQAAVRKIEEVMASHGNAAMDNSDTASDPGRLLEQQAPVQHGAGGAAVG